jgi:hypothetical protein
MTAAGRHLPRLKTYVAWIGVLLFRAATSTAASGGGCPSNLSDITPLAVDKNAGTHKFYKGFFSMRAHLGANCIDGHGLIFDSWAMHAYTAQLVIEDSMFLGNGQQGLHFFKSSSYPGYVKTSTFYGNHTGANGVIAGQGEVVLQESNGYTFDRNIMQSIAASQSGYGGESGKLYAIASLYSGLTVAFTNNDYIGVNGQHYCDF